MGASFRSKEQVLALAGCDYLTIAPNWLQALADSKDPVVVHLNAEESKKSDVQKSSFNEDQFRAEMLKDECATFKLKEGIDKFSEDTVKLEDLIKKKLHQ